MRILVTGAKGQLGGEIRRIPAEYADATADYVDYNELDITDEPAVLAWFDGHGYDLVVNCAGFTNVDACEVQEEAAFAVNALGAGNLARACETQGAKIVHISTDYVFPGDDPRPRREDDVPRPISAYGRTKLAGEELVREGCARHFICRTAWLYGYEGKNFVRTMRQLGASRNEVAVVDDQVGNPTSANDLAYEILRVAATDDYGIYHMTNEGTCSWAELAERVMVKSGLNCQVIPVTSEQYKKANPQSADRPHYSSLENARLAKTIGNDMRLWQDAVDIFIENLGPVRDA